MNTLKALVRIVKRTTVFITLLLVAGAILAAFRFTGSSAPLLAAAAGMPDQYLGTTPAPDFPAGLDWINTGGKPISIKELKGKVVLLDFWTYGCINCFHIIPDLKRLEAKYPQSLVIIGVHSAKFATEGKTAHIAAVVQRYGLEHPVVNDNQLQVWNEYGAQGWPTLTVIDPAGNVVGQVSGEGNYALLDKVIGTLTTEFAAKKQLDTRPLWFAGLHDKMPDTQLLYPGKVLADQQGGRLFIADSNHDRIVVTTLDGKVSAVIGDGKPGLKDGAFGAAEFHYPQGMTLFDANTLYVADTDNSALRRVDLKQGTVTTVAGDGVQTYMQDGDEPAAKSELDTPWDVLAHNGLVYIAMAGQHQIWTYDPAKQRIQRFAGSGSEGIDDGPLADASFAQPSGLTTDGSTLYVADPEASAVRAVDLRGNTARIRTAIGGDMFTAKVKTLIGLGLFTFGDVDGMGNEVRLQHDLGVAWYGGHIYIADTYNGKIKVLDPSDKSVTTLVGGDLLEEPGGLSVGGDTLYVADTDHDRIVTVDLKTGKAAPLTLSDPDKKL
ncbi:MAG TPA: thioredoxin-like domain-containing protein [Gammaproteobacteria bacterium]|jgi:sugar lactone lactonase YvrE/thiol-disulfide isomerase/thioredoxin